MATIRRTVDLANLSPLTEEERAQIERVRDMSDDEIDLSDIPELPASFERGRKRNLSLEVDANDEETRPMD